MKNQSVAGINLEYTYENHVRHICFVWSKWMWHCSTRRIFLEYSERESTSSWWLFAFFRTGTKANEFFNCRCLLYSLSISFLLKSAACKSNINGGRELETALGILVSNITKILSTMVWLNRPHWRPVHPSASSIIQSQWKITLAHDATY